MDRKSQNDTPSTPLDARMVRTRAALRDALLVLLEEKPLDQITIRDITARSETGYATFFRHHETKAALLDDLVADQIRDLMQLTLPVLWETDTRAAARALCVYVSERRKLWSALLTGGAAGSMREEFIRQARQVPPQASNPDSWLPDDLRVIYGVSATVEILAWWLQQRQDFSVDRVAEILDRLVIAPSVTRD